MRKSLAGRFGDKFTPEPNTGCWLWIASLNTQGYGQIGRTGRDGRHRPHGAHRVAWELHRGAIPRGQFVLHRCDTPSCVNPWHLFLGTQAENMMDKTTKGRQQRGISHAMAVLAESDIEAIRASAGVRQKDLAKSFGVTQSTISRIRSRCGWRHIP